MNQIVITRFQIAHYCPNYLPKQLCFDHIGRRASFLGLLVFVEASSESFTGGAGGGVGKPEKLFVQDTEGSQRIKIILQPHGPMGPA